MNFSEAKYVFVITCQIQTGGGGVNPPPILTLKRTLKSLPRLGLISSTNSRFTVENMDNI